MVDTADMKSGLQVLAVADAAGFASWLAAHPTAAGLWIRFAKKGAGWSGISKEAALDVALCHGWIDGQAAKDNEDSFLMRFSPRRPRSLWSQINCARAEALIAAGRMRSEGMLQITAARADGRWDAAYPPPSAFATPCDVSAALAENPVAEVRFHALSKSQRYQRLLAIVTKKKPETRERKIRELIADLTVISGS